MKQLITEQQIVGKTVKTAFETNYEDGRIIIIVFTDETFINLTTDYDEKFISTYYQIDLTPRFENAKILEKMGVINREAFDKIYTDVVIAKQEAQIEQEIEQLKELKKKYPNV